MDVPTAHFDGTGDTKAFIFGVGEPFKEPVLKRLYPGGRGDYMRMFEGALTSAHRGGFILAADRQEIAELASAAWQFEQTPS